MDEEWEVLSADGFFGYCRDSEKIRDLALPKIAIDANYFVCPASPPRSTKCSLEYRLPIPAETDRPSSKEQSNLPVEPKQLLDPSSNPNPDPQHDAVSQVSFKKMKENEFVDLKLDSPKKPFCAAAKGFLPPDDMNSGHFKEETFDGKIASPRMNFWKGSLTGVGAICSFGVVAAATICIIILGSHQRSENQNLRVQIYDGDKRIKHVVHQAAKLNEALSFARGVPVSRISYGGCYDAL